MSKPSSVKPEYPRPQLVRDSYINLNGNWEFEFDNSLSEKEKGIYKRHLKDKIIVPFCPESKLSGIEEKDYINKVWYRKDFTANCGGKRLILHFGAIDWESELFINGVYVAAHRGGYVPFDCDITDYVKNGENYLTVSAYDDAKNKTYGSGKQVWDLKPRSCLYTRTTGIWQTVWMEYVDNTHIDNIKAYPNISDTSVTLEILLSECEDVKVDTVIAFDGRICGKKTVPVYSKSTKINVPLSERHLWEIGEGNLYDIKLTLIKNGKVTDEVFSYFGLREICLSKEKFLLNGKSLFQRLVLDQGYYPDGVYTSPDDDAIKNDILCALQLGFNGARLHEKIFEPRYLYWADKLGFIVWGEYPDWGMNRRDYTNIHNFIKEWLEVINRDFNHPSVIGWCPFNEIHLEERNYDFIADVFRITKAIDPTRPVIDVSGYFHTDETDIVDMHFYEQNLAAFGNFFKEPNLSAKPKNLTAIEYDWKRIYKKGVPLFISEYGGIGFGNNENSWGYGDYPETEEEFIERYKGLTEALLFNENIMGFCYTQLYDVEQETNGLMTYQRKYKLPPEIIRKINTQIAAIEDNV